MIPLDTITAIYASLVTLLHTLNMDAVNGMFEALAGFFVLNHCRVLYAHKGVRGLSIASVMFFTLWGIWNLFYYPALGQPLSFYGGMFVSAANALYVGMLLSYRSQDAMRVDVYLGTGK